MYPVKTSMRNNPGLLLSKLPVTAGFLIFLAVLAALIPDARAQSGRKRPNKEAGVNKTAVDSSKKKEMGIEDKIKMCRKFEGLFTLYQDTTDGKLFLLVKGEQFEREYIYWSYAENGPVGAGMNKGSFRYNELIRLRKYFDRIDFELVNNRYHFDPANPLSRSAEANISHALLLSEKIVARDDSSNRYLIEAGNLYIDEKLDRVRPARTENSPAGLLGSLNKGKSRVLSIRNYPQNTDVVVELVYDNSALSSAGTDMADGRSVSVRLQHTFLELPTDGYLARRDDPRIGFFHTQFDDMTSTETVNYRDFINRWHLIKKNPEQKISEPVRPIVWWIENTTPIEYRPIIRKAALQWNLAFEQAGFRNALEIREQPDTADWDAGDLRYNVLRWTSSPFPPFGGYGPSFVDPRTGQILGADIMLEQVFVLNRLKQSDLFGQSNLEGLESDHHQSGQHHNQTSDGTPAGCDFGQALHQQIMLGWQTLEGIGGYDPRKKQYLEESLYYLVMHELGHTLGLNHNMRASQLHAPADIHNAERTRSIGLLASVMDYPAVNLHIDTAKQGQYFTTRPGPYDLWAIEYGYSAALPDSMAEAARLMDIAARSTRAELAFGNDADDMRSPGKGIDPRVNVGDLSSDAIQYAGDRLALVRHLTGGLLLRQRDSQASHQKLVQAYSILSTEMASAASVLSRYVGGVYVDRAFVGQEGAGRPLNPVPLSEQKRALDIICNQLLGPSAFQQTDSVFAYLQIQRRGFNFFSQTEDPKIHQRVWTIQKAALDHILHPTTMQRIEDCRVYGGDWGGADVLNRLSRSIYRDEPFRLNTFRQNLQMEYLMMLIDVARPGSTRVNVMGSRYGQLARTVALAELIRLRKDLARQTEQEPSALKGHFDVLRYRLSRALDARD
jgi:hypothetical protein